MHTRSDDGGGHASVDTGPYVIGGVDIDPAGYIVIHYTLQPDDDDQRSGPALVEYSHSARIHYTAAEQQVGELFELLRDLLDAADLAHRNPPKQFTGRRR